MKSSILPAGFAVLLLMAANAATAFASEAANPMLHAAGTRLVDGGGKVPRRL